MKLLKLFITVGIFAMISCTNNKKTDDHGHDHGPNGEHLDEGAHDHGIEGSHEQETFEIKKDSLNMDTLNKQNLKKSDQDTHTHADGTSHSH